MTASVVATAAVRKDAGKDATASPNTRVTVPAIPPLTKPLMIPFAVGWSSKYVPVGELVCVDILDCTTSHVPVFTRRCQPYVVVLARAKVILPCSMTWLLSHSSHSRMEPGYAFEYLSTNPASSARADASKKSPLTSNFGSSLSLVTQIEKVKLSIYLPNDTHYRRGKHSLRRCHSLDFPSASSLQ